MQDGSKTDEWTQDARFAHYWLNYHQGQSWFHKHQIAYWRSKAAAASYENSFLHWLLRTPVEVEKMSNLELNPNLSQQEEEPLQEEGPTEAEIEMEISEDMLGFIAHSMKHKRERDQVDTTQQQTYINIDEVPIETTVSSCPENLQIINQITSEHYLKLYGANASKIQAMETAIQLNFNRNCDRRQPKLWPNMPLQM